MLQAVPTRGKRRNVEKRREKSRCAARSRREKEAGIFTDLYVTVPIVSESTITHVDRIAVLRLAATLCRIRRVAEKVFPLTVKELGIPSNEIFAEASINECMDGFLMMIDSSGLIIYISPNCSRSLGLTQTDLIGQNLHDYLHVDDSVTLGQTLDNAAMTRLNSLLRMKSVLSPRGRNLTLKSAVYKPVSFVVKKSVVEFPPVQPRRPSSRGSPGEGAVMFTAGDGSDFDEDDDGNASPDNSPVTQLDTTYYVMHGLPLVHCGAGAMGDYHGPGTFMTRHTMDMKFSYCHERLTDYLGYDNKSLMNSSFFSLVHPQDVPCLTASLKELYRKGHVSTGYYRLMVKSGGYVWVTTAGNTVTHSTRGHGGQYIVCVHQLISQEESNDVTADVQQTSPSLLSKMETERKIKHAKIIGPSTEQLLQRAPTVNDYIPLTNPNSLSVNAFGGLSASMSGGDMLGKNQSQGRSTEKGNEFHQDWLFRAVGGTEARDARQRGGHGECANTAIGNTKRVNIDAAARNFSQTQINNNSNTSRDNSVLVSPLGPFDTITQADIERVLFPVMPVTSVRSAPAIAGGPAAVVGQTRGAQPQSRAVPAQMSPPARMAPQQMSPPQLLQQPHLSPPQQHQPATPMTNTKPDSGQDNLSSLAPFIHHTDEILSLDFGQNGIGMGRFSPGLDELDLDFDSVNDYSSGALYLLQESAIGGARPIAQAQSSPPDQIDDRVKIESIYRYLRDDDEEIQNGQGSGQELSGLPPLLIMEPGDDQKCPSLVSPWQYQSSTPPYGLTPVPYPSPRPMACGQKMNTSPHCGSKGMMTSVQEYMDPAWTAEAQSRGIHGNGRMCSQVGGVR